VSLTREDLAELALEVTGMTRTRWDLLLETLKDDAAMNRIMKEEWERKPRDSEEAIREYYRESDIWFLNTWNHGIGGLVKMAGRGAPALSSRWSEVFVRSLKIPCQILDYGGGFFNDTYPLVMSGYKVSVAEVEGPVTAFLRRYRTLAGLEDRMGIVDVGSDLPLQGMYDGAVCFETLEHLLHPAELARHLRDHINPEGPFAFSVSFGAPAHAPYHVASNAPLGDERVWAAKLEEIGFLPFWKDAQNPHFQVWRRP